jgi:RHS repeat-associated protein
LTSWRYYDSGIDLYYYGYRFYSAYLCRWLNRDPIGEEGGLNLYAFCGNDGVNRWDLLGMVPDFATFWFYYNKYSYHAMTAEEVWQAVGGAVSEAVYQTVPAGTVPNACATACVLPLVVPQTTISCCRP